MTSFFVSCYIAAYHSVALHTASKLISIISKIRTALLSMNIVAVIPLRPQISKIIGRVQLFLMQKSY